MRNISQRLASLFVNVCFKVPVVLEFPAVGDRNNSSGALENAGTNGFYWSSTQNSSTNAYDMNFNSGNVNTNNNDKRNGFSVRCVRREFTTLKTIRVAARVGRQAVQDNCPRVPRKFSRLLGAKKHSLSRKNGDAIRFPICRLRAGSCTAFCKRLLTSFCSIRSFPLSGTVTTTHPVR